MKGALWSHCSITPTYVDEFLSHLWRDFAACAFQPLMARPLDRFLNRLLQRSPLSAAARRALLAIDARPVQKRARWDVVRAGDEVSHASLVAEGLVARSEQFANGTRRTAAYYVPGDMCDLHSVAVPLAGWNITALTDCTIFEVPHRDLRQLFDRHSDLAMALWRDTVADASILAKWVTLLSGGSARQRLAHLLCEYGIRIQSAGLGSRADFPYPLTQAQTAEIIGTTAVHLSRVVKQLCREGLIEQKRSEILVRDLPLLERTAEYDPQYLLLEKLQRAAPEPA